MRNGHHGFHSPSSLCRGAHTRALTERGRERCARVLQRQRGEGGARCVRLRGRARAHARPDEVRTVRHRERFIQAQGLESVLRALTTGHGVVCIAWSGKPLLIAAQSAPKRVESRCRTDLLSISDARSRNARRRHRTARRPHACSDGASYTTALNARPAAPRRHSSLRGALRSLPRAIAACVILLCWRATRRALRLAHLANGHGGSCSTNVHVRRLGRLTFGACSGRCH